MHTQLSTKLAALGVALLVNSTMIGGVAYLFSGQLSEHTALTTLAQASTPASVESRV